MNESLIAILKAIEVGGGVVSEIIAIWKTEDDEFHIAQLKAGTREAFQQQITTATEWLQAHGRE